VLPREVLDSVPNAHTIQSVGQLVVAGRKGIERLYDLPERVLPSEVLDAPVPDLAVAVFSPTEGGAVEREAAAVGRARRQRLEVVVPCGCDGRERARNAIALVASRTAELIAEVEPPTHQRAIEIERAGMLVADADRRERSVAMGALRRSIISGSTTNSQSSIIGLAPAVHPVARGNAARVQRACGNGFEFEPAGHRDGNSNSARGVPASERPRIVVTPAVSAAVRLDAARRGAAGGDGREHVTARNRNRHSDTQR